MDSIARFDFSIEDADADYQMILYLRHTDRFPYQNMWIYATEKETQDTIEFYLADDRGQWLGDKKHGFIEMPVLLEENRHFADTGRYSLEIQHGMRDTLLRGVTDVGLEIRRNGKK
jgi:gliding motility-associated lipoprotein GldH